ncbi:MAG TPA: hypothetical protein VGC54_14760 [Planctomycetota bacterium]
MRAAAAELPHPGQAEIDRLLRIHLALVAEQFRPAEDVPAGAAACERRFELELAGLIARCGGSAAPTGAAAAVVGKLAELREHHRQDVNAALRNDPAAQSRLEIEACYPGVRAIGVHRLARLLVAEGVPLLPRMLAARSHAGTGVDIHPGAEIGCGFFIDHGSGVVIGETTTIGAQVVLYQGVTLGALHFPRDEHGRVIRVAKRHPTLEDQVVVYANATILGGATVVGAGSVVGAGVMLTASVAPGTVVVPERPRLLRSERSAPSAQTGASIH